VPSLLPSLVHSEQEFQIKILKSRYLKRIYCFSSLIGQEYVLIPLFPDLEYSKFNFSQSHLLVCTMV
jgi:hypothetical protein